MSAESPAPDTSALRLMQAFDNREFIAVYQPVFELSTGSIIGVESLVRWRHPELGLLRPAAFLDEVHNCSLSNELTTATLENVCRDMGHLLSLYGPSVLVGVNLSSAQLQDPEMLALFDEVVGRNAVDPARLIVEVVEDLRSEHMLASAAAIKGLRERAVQVALDDFGTGAGTLSLLIDLAYDGIKIDRHFTSQLRHSGPARSVIEVMLAFSQENGTVVVAEGVEDESTLRELRTMGCGYAQGFHLAPPCEVEELTNFTLDLRVGTRTVPPETSDLEHWSAQFHERIPLAPNTSHQDLVALIAPVEAEIQALPAGQSDVLLVDLGRHKMLAAFSAGHNALAMEWGLEASRLAEDHGLTGRTATILSVLSGIGPEPSLENDPTTEALARVLTLRLSGELSNEELTVVDNNLGVTLANFGLWEHAAGWWHSAIAHQSNSLSQAMSALNLAEASLDRLALAPWTQHVAPTNADRHLLETACDVLTENSFTPDGLLEAVDGRCAILENDLDRAEASLYTPGITGGLGEYSVRFGRVLLAEARHEPETFLDLSEALLQSLRGIHSLRYRAERARWTKVRALAANGRHQEALELQQVLTIDERRRSADHLTHFFEWMQLMVDVNRRYSQLADLKPPPTV